MSDLETAIARAARRTSRGNNSSSIRLPRTPQLSLHLGTIAAADTNTNTAHFQFNDPSGLVIPGVRVCQTYGGGFQPAAGHLAWAFHNGTDFMILGQHVIPTNLVAP